MAGEDYDEHMKSVGDLPVLFINGEIDFREAEMKWLNAAKNGRLEVRVAQLSPAQPDCRPTTDHVGRRSLRRRATCA
jgi:hypothetical protein